MSPAQPTLSYTPAVNVEVVTVTLVSSSTLSPSTLPSSSGGRSSVPIGAIVGGIAGGMALAISVVLVWKYWGRVIQRTERKRRKEAQDMLTVRENTRRNATTGFQPESQYRPMLNFNPEHRRVTFLARTPSRADQAETDTTLSAAAAPIEEKGNNQEAPIADPGTGETTEAQQPLPSSALPAATLLVHDSPAELDRKREGGERPLEEKAKSTLSRRRSLSPTPSRGTPRRPPSPSPSSSRSAPRRVPSPSPSRSTSRRSASPASSHSTSRRASMPVPSSSASKRASLPAPSPSHHTSKRASLPVPSRSVRMRTPQRLPDPPPVPPLPTLKAGDTRLSIATSTRSGISISPPRPPSPSSSRIQGTAATSRSTSPVSSVNPIPTAGSSTASLPSSSTSHPTTWTRSPLRNSVLSSDRPVIMPRPKNASASVPSPPEWQPASLMSSTLASTPSQYSGASGEQSMPRGFFDSLGRIRSFVGSAGGNMRPESTQSSASAYSNG